MSKYDLEVSIIKLGDFTDDAIVSLWSSSDMFVISKL